MTTPVHKKWSFRQVLSAIWNEIYESHKRLLNEKTFSYTRLPLLAYCSGLIAFFVFLPISGFRRALYFCGAFTLLTTCLLTGMILLYFLLSPLDRWFDKKRREKTNAANWWNE